MSGKQFLDLPDLPDETHYDDPPAAAAEQLRRTLGPSAQHIGKTGHVSITVPGGSFCLLVGVVNVRRCYGRLDYLVTPMDDESFGSAWIEAGRFRPEP